jgi:hypothetical protein
MATYPFLEENRFDVWNMKHVAHLCYLMRVRVGFCHLSPLSAYCCLSLYQTGAYLILHCCRSSI